MNTAIPLPFSVCGDEAPDPGTLKVTEPVGSCTGVQVGGSEEVTRAVNVTDSPTTATGFEDVTITSVESVSNREHNSLSGHTIYRHSEMIPYLQRTNYD